MHSQRYQHLDECEDIVRAKIDQLETHLNSRRLQGLSLGTGTGRTGRTGRGVGGKVSKGQAVMGKGKGTKSMNEDERVGK
jgi:hypothetical protein